MFGLSQDFPAPSFYFSVFFFELFSQVSFQEVSGLEVEKVTEEIAAGGVPYKYKVPSIRKFNNLTLKRGTIVYGDMLSTWVNTQIESEFNFPMIPMDILIQLHNPGQVGWDTVMSWAVVHATPVKWSFSNLNSEKSELMIETMELSFHQMKVIYGF